MPDVEEAVKVKDAFRVVGWTVVLAVSIAGFVMVRVHDMQTDINTLKTSHTYDLQTLQGNTAAISAMTTELRALSGKVELLVEARRR